MNITSKTRTYAIFGHPVEHSLSPVMHNAAFKERDIDGVYVAFDVAPENIGTAVKGIRSLGISGVNVTIPHKETVMNYLDEISDDARLVGAVNTINNDKGKLTGYNTDVNGLLRAVEDDLEFTPEGKKIFLIGAGGAARAVIAGLGRSGASEITVVNRTLSKAESLADEFGGHFLEVNIESAALGDEAEVKRHIKECDILINASSAGMKDKNLLKLPLQLLKKTAVVYDLVYEPKDTQLVIDARETGIKASSGLSMLVFQGAESFEIWTGASAPLKVMKKILDGIRG